MTQGRGREGGGEEKGVSTDEYLDEMHCFFVTLLHPLSPPQLQPAPGHL